MFPSLWDDTSPAAAHVVIEGYRRMSSVRKAEAIAALTASVQQLALARLRTEDPAANDETLQLRLAALWLPAELIAHVVARRAALRPS